MKEYQLGYKFINQDSLCQFSLNEVMRVMKRENRAVIGIRYP